MTDVHQLQKEVEELQSQRRDVENRLRELQPQRRTTRIGRGIEVGPPADKRWKARQPEPVERNDSFSSLHSPRRGDDIVRRQPRIASAVGAAAPAAAAAEEPEPSGPVAKPEADTSEESVRRNKRMFGSILGHLGQARDRLQKDAVLFEKQKAVEQSVQERDREEQRSLREKQVQLLRAEREKELQLRDSILMKQSIASVQLMTARWQTYHSSLGNFLQTKTHPRLLFIPARLNDKTKAMVAARQAASKEKVDRLKEEADAMIKAAEDEAVEKKQESEAHRIEVRKAAIAARQERHAARGHADADEDEEDEEQDGDGTAAAAGAAEEPRADDEDAEDDAGATSTGDKDAKRRRTDDAATGAADTKVDES